jgi:hypothetical protein
MRKSRYTDEQIIGFIKQADAGMSVADLCRREGFSSATFYKWRAKFGGMEATGEVRSPAPSDNRRRHPGAAANPGVIYFNPADSSHRLVRVLGAGQAIIRSAWRGP